jgi:hypothetical protein
MEKRHPLSPSPHPLFLHTFALPIQKGSAKKLLGKKREPGSIGRVYQEKTNEQEAQDGV